MRISAHEDDKVDLSETRLTEAQWLDIIRLAQARGTDFASEQTGLTRRRIREKARKLGMTVQSKPSEVPQHVKQERVEAVDMRRVQLKGKLLERAHDLVDRMGQPYAIVTKDGEEVFLARPPARESKDLAIAAGIIMDKMRLEMGEVTSRSEHVQRDAVDDELFRLAQEISTKAAEDEVRKAGVEAVPHPAGANTTKTRSV